MEVSMDGLRKQMINNYNSLTRKLNKSIKKYDTFGEEVTISPDEIQREMDELRMCIVTLAFSYIDGEFGIIEDAHFESFNHET